MHEHTVTLAWRRTTPGFAYEEYNRDHRWVFDAGIEVRASAAAPFRGEPDCVDPEEAFVASLAACHMLSFLAIASRKRLVVDTYADEAVGILDRDAEGKLVITRVTLQPQVRFREDAAPDTETLRALHDRAHHECFLANSVKSDVQVAPR